MNWTTAFDEQALPDLKSAAIDFRAASELFAPYRRLTAQAWSVLRITTEHQGRQVPTAGGLLLFGKDRFARFPDAWIQAGRFAGINRTRLLDSAETRSYLPRAAEDSKERPSASLFGTGPHVRVARWESLMCFATAAVDRATPSPGKARMRRSVAPLIPLIEKSSDARPLIERIAGPYMGANFKKGRTFAWLLTHIRDGNGHAMPRALVRLIEKAASQELDRPLATYNRLLDPRSLRRALDDVSKEHVLEVNTHELPWLPGVKDRLDGSGVPMLRREAERLLNHRWDDSWSKSQTDARPPADTASELVTQLTEIGVFKVRPDGRIDVPDLFMAGLGLSRKGGVRKR